MSLSKHINSENILQQARDHRSHAHHLTKSDPNQNSAAYGARYGTEPIPKYKIPSKGADAQATYQLIHDELTLDGSPLLNLASFVHTWMPEQADKLMTENMSKNLIDQDEYPITRAHHFFKLCAINRVNGKSLCQKTSIHAVSIYSLSQSRIDIY